MLQARFFTISFDCSIRLRTYRDSVLGILGGGLDLVSGFVRFHLTRDPQDMAKRKMLQESRIVNLSNRPKARLREVPDAISSPICSFNG